MAKLRNKLTTSDEFFVRHHLTEKTMSVAEIAAAIGVKEECVKAIADAERAAHEANLKRDHFEVNDGTVSGSQAQSRADDEMKKGDMMRQKNFLERNKRNFIVMDPNKPIR